MNEVKDKKRMSVYLDYSLAQRLEAYCAEFGISRNSGVCLLLTTALDSEEMKKSLMDFGSLENLFRAKFAEIEAGNKKKK